MARETGKQLKNIPQKLFEIFDIGFQKNFCQGLTEVFGGYNSNNGKQSIIKRKGA